MGLIIGIFETERQVITAVDALEQVGFVPGEIKIVAKDDEHAHRIEAETDVHADELLEHGDGSGTGEGTHLSMVSAAMLTGSLSGLGGGFPAAGGAAVYPFAVMPVLNHEGGSDRFLHQLGLDDAQLHMCNDAVQHGSCLVLVEVDGGETLVDVDGGPDMSRGNRAIAAFKQCGASQVIEQS